MIPGIDNFQIKKRDIILSQSSFFCWIYLKRKMSKFVIHERLADWRFRLFSVRAIIEHFCWGFFKRFLAQFLTIEIFLQFFNPAEPNEQNLARKSPNHFSINPRLPFRTLSRDKSTLNVCTHGQLPQLSATEPFKLLSIIKKLQ